MKTAFWRRKWKRSDSSDSDSVTLMTLLPTPIFDFHWVISTLVAPLTTSTLTSPLVKTSRYWAIPENIHTKSRTSSMFYPPLAFGNSKMCYPPMPSEFHNREPPLPFRISVFLEVHFRLSNAYMNKRTWIYASSRLWSNGARQQALL